jgi:hypothetical protein
VQDLEALEALGERADLVAQRAPDEVRVVGERLMAYANRLKQEELLRAP